MIRASLTQAARWVDGVLEGPDREFAGVSTDSRTLTSGQLFAALSGPNFDAHEFLDQAVARGAAGALVDRLQPSSLGQMRVDDTRLALGRLARAWRETLAATVVAVTGSNGKTTVKEMLGAILGAQDPILMTRGNLNNDIGVPLTLFRLGPAHRWAVLELGANHAGEIAYLGELVKPAVSVITNAGPAHLEGFGSVEGVAHAKGELISALDADGVAVYNGDDEHVEVWRELRGERSCLEFGLGPGCQVRGELQKGEFDLVYAGQRRRIELPVPGRHNVMNALAAAAAALALGLDLDAISAGLAGVASVPGRLELVQGVHGARLVDDTYNANPRSLEAALETVASEPGSRWLVLGDMKELGETGAELHAAAGARARSLGFQRLFTLGSLSAEAAAAFGSGGESFDSLDELCERLKRELQAGAGSVTILVKGSRGMRMERVVAALRRPEESS